MTIVLNGTTGITTPGTDSTTLVVNSNNISAVNSLGFRNRIINGAMVIDQRNAGASVTPTTTQYVLDRWQITVAQASKLSVQQSSTAPAGFVNSTLITSLSAYSVGASDYFDYRQSIEGFNVADLAWGTASAATITLSFWVRSSLTGTFGGAVKNSAANRSYPFTYTISAANTWEQKSVTIAGDTSGTWVTNSGAGLILQMGLGVGSTFSGTAGAWAGANYLSATGATSVVGTNGATFYITGVQLEAGSVASPFERRDYGRELIMCQRYYQQLGGENAYERFGSGMNYSTSAGYSLYALKVTMRTAPAIATVGSLVVLTAAGAVVTYSTLAVNSQSSNNLNLTFTGASGLVAGYATQLLSNNDTTARLQISAEL